MIHTPVDEDLEDLIPHLITPAEGEDALDGLLSAITLLRLSRGGKLTRYQVGDRKVYFDRREVLGLIRPQRTTAA